MDRTTKTPIPATDRPIILELTRDQLALVEAGVKLLLVIEDDHETIHELKDLIGRVHVLQEAAR